MNEIKNLEQVRQEDIYSQKNVLETYKFVFGMIESVIKCVDEDKRESMREDRELVCFALKTLKEKELPEDTRRYYCGLANEIRKRIDKNEGVKVKLVVGGAIIAISAAFLIEYGKEILKKWISK